MREVWACPSQSLGSRSSVQVLGWITSLRAFRCDPSRGLRCSVSGQLAFELGVRVQSVQEGIIEPFKLLLVFNQHDLLLVVPHIEFVHQCEKCIGVLPSEPPLQLRSERLQDGTQFHRSTPHVLFRPGLLIEEIHRVPDAFVPFRIARGDLLTRQTQYWPLSKMLLQFIQGLCGKPDLMDLPTAAQVCGTALDKVLIDEMRYNSIKVLQVVAITLRVVRGVLQSELLAFVASLLVQMPQ